ncbi:MULTISPECIES: hypothetical protein [Paenibacillus]|uniref:hypothetical protein n=1 Tax=Paenibacillus TaxID=44249 RepID=UPI00203F4CC2|nr:hypothetical protein [Paenibacillus lactis]MCM3493796.1 hypothetical protein [Paenibacillus lactis]
MLFKDVVLLGLAHKKEKQEVYTHFSREGKVDDFIEALYHLNKDGLVYVPLRAWSPKYDGVSIPNDVVMTGVKLTPYGESRAKHLITKHKKSL